MYDLLLYVQHISLSFQVVYTAWLNLCEEGQLTLTRAVRFSSNWTHRTTVTDSASSVNETNPPVLPTDLIPVGFEEIQTSFRERLKSYRLIELTYLAVPPQEFLSNAESVFTLMCCIQKNLNAIKIKACVECEHAHVCGKTRRRAFKTKNVTFYQTSDVEEICQEYNL